MACQGCTNEARPTAAAFDRVFDRFWPAALPFPPAAPYLAAAVGRAEARQWATDIGADRDLGVLSGDPIALLDMVGKAMMDPAEAFAGKRKKKKKEEDQLPRTCTGSRHGSIEACDAAGRQCESNAWGCRPMGLNDWCMECQDGPGEAGGLLPAEVGAPT